MKQSTTQSALQLKKETISLLDSKTVYGAQRTGTMMTTSVAMMA